MRDCYLSQLFEQMARRHRLELFEIESQNVTEYVKVMLYDEGARVKTDGIIKSK